MTISRLFLDIKKPRGQKNSRIQKNLKEFSRKLKDFLQKLKFWSNLPVIRLDVVDVVYLDVVAKSLGQTINFQVGYQRKKILVLP